MWYDRIDWVDNDLLSIYETDGSHTDQLDYKVASHSTHESIYQNSVATVAPNAANDRLVWLSDNSHTFYSLYPSPTTEGVDATKVSLSGNTITATIPTLQVVTAAASGSLVYKPDMNYAYMWAATTAESGSDVSLNFKPLMTAFEITIGTTDANGLVLTSFALATDDNSTYLAGDFTATIGADLSSYTVSNITNGPKAIAVTFDNVPITTEAPVTFTVFALPVQLTGLTLKFTFSNGTSKELKLQSRASETDPWEYMTLEGGRKYRLNNLSIPADGWIYTLQEVTTGAAMALHQAAVGTADKGMYSYRTKADDNTVVEEVAMKFRYAPADAISGEPGEWSENLPDWLTSLVAAAHTTEDPDDAFTLTGTYTELPQSNEETLNEIEDHIALLKANGNNNATSAEPQDLALYDIDNLDSPRSAGVKTANSYVVDKAGWYMFPLIYGNAIDCVMGDENGWNVGSYYDGSGEEDWDSNRYYVLHRLRNYLNVGITTPYILDDVNLGVDAVEAVIVWEDAAQENIFINTAEVVANPSTTASYKAADGTAKTVPYIRFDVDADNIRQGNAVIALRKVSDQTIIWSWQIWVTDTDLTTQTVPTRSTTVTSNQMLKVNLGWCDTRITTRYYYVPRTYYVEVTQVDGSGNAIGNAAPVVFAVTQDEEEFSKTVISSATFYQYGRKDPFLPAKGELLTAQNELLNKDSYSPAGYTIVTSDNTISYENQTPSGFDGNVSYGIQNPYIMLYRGSDSNGSWAGGEAQNFWNMPETAGNTHPSNSYNPVPSKDKIVTKTIYDPCPPGFSIPNYMAFTIFTSTGGQSTWNLAEPEVDSSVLYTGTGSETITFPWHGFRWDGMVDQGYFYYYTAKASGDRYSVVCTKRSPTSTGGTSKGNAYTVRPVKEIP